MMYYGQGSRYLSQQGPVRTLQMFRLDRLIDFELIESKIALHGLHVDKYA
jgi:hypothetical protein